MTQQNEAAILKYKAVLEQNIRDREQLILDRKDNYLQTLDSLFDKNNLVQYYLTTLRKDVVIYRVTAIESTQLSFQWKSRIKKMDSIDTVGGLQQLIEHISIKIPVATNVYYFKTGAASPSSYKEYKTIRDWYETMSNYFFYHSIPATHAADQIHRPVMLMPITKKDYEFIVTKLTQNSDQLNILNTIPSSYYMHQYMHNRTGTLKRKLEDELQRI